MLCRKCVKVTTLPHIISVFSLGRHWVDHVNVVRFLAGSQRAMGPLSCLSTPFECGSKVEISLLVIIAAAVQSTTQSFHWSDLYEVLMLLFSPQCSLVIQPHG